jgi:hypothetical protein
MSYRDITVIPLWDSTLMATGTTLTSVAIDLGQKADKGYFSLQIFTEGSGTSVCARYIISNDGRNFLYPSGASQIVVGTTAFHHMCGISKDGRDIVQFSPILGARMKIQLWNSVAGTGATVTAHLAVQ